MATRTPPDYYHALYDVARTINSSLRLPQVLNLIVESTARALGAKACVLRLLDSAHVRLEVEASHGLSEAYVGKGPVEIAHSPVDAEALRGQAVQIRDAAHDSRLQYPAAAAAEGIASMLVVPVKVKDTVIGVVRVYTAERHEFAPDEVDFVEIVANLGGIAIENARVYEALEAQFETIRREKVPWAENFAKPSWR